MKIKTAAVIIIGDEILSGQVYDRNTYFLASKLQNLGTDLKIIVTIPDDIATIAEWVSSFRQKYDFVITSGGIGPTPDDKTREGIAKGVGLNLELNKEAKKELDLYYKGKINEKRLLMAYMPEGAAIIKNPETGAPAFKIENIYVFPGVPILLEKLFEIVKEEFRSVPIYKESFITNIGESFFAHLMDEIPLKFKEVSVGSYPKIEKKPYCAELVLKSRNKEELEKARKWLYMQIKKIEV